MNISRFSLKDLFIAVLITALVTTSVQLAAFWESSPSIARTVKGPYESILPSANAQTAGAGSSSVKHKDFDGGWILPIEIFEQDYQRVTVLGGFRGVYNSKPMMIDINGDGLIDQVYSKMSTHPEGSYDVITGLDQYIKLQRTNGTFETVYTCRQISTSSGRFQYIGHCADVRYTPSSTGRDPHEMGWTPLRYFYQFAVPGKSFVGSGNTQVGGLFERKYHETDHTKDYALGKFMDMNGDGLPDLVFSSNLREPNSPIANGTGSINMVLYNNGNGFDVGYACFSMNIFFPQSSPVVIPFKNIFNNGNYCVIQQ